MNSFHLFTHNEFMHPEDGEMAKKAIDNSQASRYTECAKKLW